MTANNQLTTERPKKASSWSLWDLIYGRALAPLADDIKMNGKVCLVTGANTGLGRAIAVQLGKRGATLVLLCRAGHEKAIASIEEEAGCDKITYIRCDLSVMKDVARACDEMKEQKIKIDVAILNAGLVSGKVTVDGLGVMFAVHVMANRQLVKRWIEDGVIKPRADTETEPPRILLVTSDLHRSMAAPVNMKKIEELHSSSWYGEMPYYARSKLLSTTLVLEWSRRFNEDVPEGQPPRIAVHAFCPGPVATDIARDQPLLRALVFFYRAPVTAARPAMLLACDPAYGKRSGDYISVMHKILPSPKACDPKSQAAVWEQTGALLDTILAGKRPATQ